MFVLRISSFFHLISLSIRFVGMRSHQCREDRDEDTQ
jgi:hypothetical protein